MAGTLNVSFEFVGEVTGGVVSMGQRQTPFAVVTLAADRVSRRRHTLPAKVGSTNTYKKLYDYTQDGDFELFALVLPAAEGYINLAIKIDIPTSTTDLTASGTGQRWINLDHSCFAPFILTSDQVRTSTLANIADWYGPTAGSANPTLMNSVNAVNGKIYEIGAWNPDTAADVVVETLLGA